MAMYAGYQIKKPTMHPWFVWIYWINPIAYAVEALMANELHEKIVPCVGDSLIPNGPEYAGQAASCAGVSGAVAGDTSLTGDQHLQSLSYDHQHVWRNLGIIWAWWALYTAVAILATMTWRSASERGNVLLIPSEKAAAHVNKNPVDEESPAVGDLEKRPSGKTQTGQRDAMQGYLARGTSIFTWKNLTYSVKTPSGERVLLDNVHGWVKPGMLGALMGSSGAGKTTLLDVLAQRKTEGTIQGSILVDGRPLPVSFQRSAGYCEQFDVHEPYATVREALEFSALLRQPQDVPIKEKLRYVDIIIDLLELHGISDTLIGKVGAGLSIEQRKRVTIGVELVSKPRILIFLDEPTSGLDGQSAYNTVRFLRKLADLGQAILVTIHQPSAQLFSQFDTLLLLAKAGKMVYFGDIGIDCMTLKDYFSRNGAPCPADVNPADHMIDVVSGNVPQAAGVDWHQVWLDSPEYTSSLAELDRMAENAASKDLDEEVDNNEFAVPLWPQVRIVTWRMTVALFRNTQYVNNKLILHIILALFNGFTYWKVENTVDALQLRLFTIFVFIFVAPGVINQLQPLFIERRELYDTREKKSRMYSWKAFVTALVVSEFPYLCFCGILYFVCWYYTVGFPTETSKAGSVFFIVLCYEFLYTGVGQTIAAFSPNSVFASLVNPLAISILVSFCGVLVPYPQLVTFWRYWMYYLDPFNYLVGGLLVFTVFDTPVNCAENEFAIFDPPSDNSTCLEYLSPYLEEKDFRPNLVNPDATSGCRVCQYHRGSDYLKTVNLNDFYYGWRNAAILVIFILSSFGMVFLIMRLRTKASKKTK